MKKAIFQKFIIVLLLALIISGSLFSVIISNIIFDNTKENMLELLKLADTTLEYNEPLDSQIANIREINTNKMIRITILDAQGNVVADSNLSEIKGVENHRDREEFTEALKTGVGAAKRQSETIQVSLLYVAYLSQYSEYVLRIAVPFTGLWDYMGQLIPALALSIGLSLLVSLVLADGFSRTITKPLYEISEELLKLKEDNPEFGFHLYRYDEMNLIADTTKQMAKELQESKKQIEFEKMVRQEFFSNASHELKTPITSVRGYAELLENNMATNEDMRREFLSRIKKETEKMTNLINDILMISRLETKEIEVTMEEVRLLPLVREVCNSLEPLAKECGVEIHIDCRPISMYANTGQIRELLNNLINNAVKYNRPGGKVSVIVTSQAKDVLLIVEDTGVGIPEDSRQRVFERFYRIDKGRSKKMGGTGLGLSIVKHVVNYYNGSIELESKEGKGSKFTIVLPNQGVSF